MARPPVLIKALAAGATALGALFLAAPPAAAQFIAPWGVRAGPPALWAQDDDMLDDEMIPPRVVGGILRSRGYQLVAPPHVSGDFIVALGENARGARMRFIIDGYSGGLVRTSLVGRERPEIFAARPDFERRIAPDSQVGARPLAESELDARPVPLAVPHRKKAKSKHRTARRDVEHKPMTHEAAPKPPAPSQATKVPIAPAPVVEPPKETATAPTPVDTTPLAPDATRTQIAPVAAPEPPKEAVVSPAPADKPALAPDVAKTESNPTTPAAKPSDIGPRVVPVAPHAELSEAPPAKAAEAAISPEATAKPADPAPAPSSPADAPAGSK